MRISVAELCGESAEDDGAGEGLVAREEEEGADALVVWGCLVVVDVVAAGPEVEGAGAGLRAVEPEAEERVDWGVLRFGAIGCGAVLGRCGLGWCWRGGLEVEGYVDGERK